MTARRREGVTSQGFRRVLAEEAMKGTRRSLRIDSRPFSFGLELPVTFKTICKSMGRQHGQTAER